MDGASSTVGESFVQFWPKLLLLWCKSAVAGASPLLVQAAAAVWCKSGAPTGEQQLWWKQGKFGASSVRLRVPRALLGSKTHTGETCSATLSLSLPPFVPRPPLTVLLHYLLCLLLFHHLLLNIVPQNIFLLDGLLPPHFL